MYPENVEKEPSWREKLTLWVDPALIMRFAVSHHLPVWWDCLWHRPKDLLTGAAYARATANFWLGVSLPATVDDSRKAWPDEPFASIARLVRDSEGAVLDIGPGTGALMRFLDISKIKSMVAVEPAVELHWALQQSATAVGFKSDNFTILPCGGEAEFLIPSLAKTGKFDLNSGPQFDTIVAIRSLCALDKPEQSIQNLYSLLKPGGKFLIFEHVVNHWRSEKGSIVGRSMQIILTVIGWPYFLGCTLSRDTAKILTDVASADGGWASVELKSAHECGTLPWTYGTFVKKDNV